MTRSGLLFFTEDESLTLSMAGFVPATHHHAQTVVCRDKPGNGEEGKAK